MVINKNLSILALTNDTETDGTILIRNEDILISENKLLSTALNNFQGIIESIIPVPVGIEVQVNIGIKLYVKLSRESFEKLNLSLGKKVWISFKASSVKFIKN